MNVSKSNKGFTLVEVLAVLALISLLLSVGIPAFSIVLKKYRLSTTTENLAGTLRYARQLAVSRQDRDNDGLADTIIANFDPGNNTYEVIYSDSSDSIRPTPKMPPGITLENDTVTGTSGHPDYNATGARFVFNSDGTINMPLTGENSVCLEMTVSSFTTRRGVIKMSSSGMIRVFYHNE